MGQKLGPPKLSRGEYLVDLGWKNYKLIESQQGFRLSMDAILLASFVTLNSGDRVLDFGCGSGIIPIYLSTRLTDLTLEGIEIQPGLWDRGQRNMALNRLQDKITLYQGDLREAENYFIPGSFDVVVCNPPFWPVGKGRSSPNPELAWAREEKGCTLAEILQQGLHMLRVGGLFALIYPWERQRQLQDILASTPFCLVRWREIRPYKNAPAKRILVEVKKTSEKKAAEGRREFSGNRESQGLMNAEEPLILYTESGKYTTEMQEIYRVKIGTTQRKQA